MRALNFSTIAPRLAAAFLAFACVGVIGDATALTFRALLTSSAVVPPNASTASGSATVELGDNGQVVISATFTGLATANTGIHIQGPAAPGANGPAIVFIPATGMTSGTITNFTATLTPEQMQQLRDRQLYFDVHTASFPGGELRGQLYPDQSLTATLSSTQVSSPHAGAATGHLRAIYNESDRRLRLDGWFGKLNDVATSAHIHGPAGIGSNGTMITSVPVTPTTAGTIQNFTMTLTPAQATAVVSSTSYFDAHSLLFPSGEVRGQLELLFDDSAE